MGGWGRKALGVGGWLCLGGSGLTVGLGLGVGVLGFRGLECCGLCGEAKS